MPYTDLLNILIKDSGLTVKEIAEKCSEYGAEITPPYISRLRNDKNNKAPSDKVSIALAKACGAKYEECLVLEAYLDRSPEILNEFFSQLKKLVVPLTMGVMENKITTQQQKEFEQIVDNLPVSTFIFDIVKENQAAKLKKEFGTAHLKAEIKGDTLNIRHEIEQNIGLVIADDGMKPQICKGDKVQFEFMEFEKLKTGDIICYTKKEIKNKIFARKIILNSPKKFSLMPINSDFTFETVNADDIIILGKVVRVISEIK